MLKLANLTSLLLPPLNTNRSRITDINLKLAFPELSTETRKALKRENHHEMIVAIFETSRFYSLSERKLLSILTLEGIENLEDAYKTGRPIIMLSSHMSTIHMCGRIKRNAIRHAAPENPSPLIAIYRPMKNKFMESLINTFRGKYAKMLPSNHMKSAITTLKHDRFCHYMLDQADPTTGVEVNFLGHKVLFNPAIRRIAKL